ncbi:MAG: hypothetical protein KJ900_00470 [Proteobacteria bacterium]|nr:hypothetical protein [Pseudomonadota bacterium]MCG2745674.1 hypothetical protein [Desulfobacteraceae bacterium]MBU3983733.1 hypothetical protein [Pseudomonadota bacterium]MBU4029424.1 hypothetical protein [Pseudomonadota bacterium]MBU4041365.1 hypothetical protein [Pseudomonadota bacterium]
MAAAASDYRPAFSHDQRTPALCPAHGIITFFLGMSRPPSSNLILEQGHKDAGTASSIMFFSYFLCGALSMAAVSLDWPDKIRYIGILALISGSCALCLWLFLRRHLYLHCGLREQFLTSIPEKTGSSMISKVKRKKEISSVDKPLSRFICRKFGLPFNQYVSLTCAALLF